MKSAMFRLPFISVLVAAVVAVLPLAGPAAVSAAPTKTYPTYDYLIGVEPICSLDPSEPLCPDIARADNGDTIAIKGSGTLSAHAPATGGGSFVHKNAAGTVLATGTWTATRLMSFKAFGADPTLGFPSSFTGGKAVMLVALWVGGVHVHDAVLTVDCDLGTNPPGISEGIKLAVKDALNFNKHVSGANVFILEG